MCMLTYLQDIDRFLFMYCATLHCNCLFLTYCYIIIVWYVSGLWPFIANESKLTRKALTKIATDRRTADARAAVPRPALPGRAGLMSALTRAATQSENGRRAVPRPHQLRDATCRRTGTQVGGQTFARFRLRL